MLTNERWHFLMSAAGADEKLTEKEVKEGWHFCFEFDGLLCNANDKDIKNCGCTCLKDTIYERVAE